MLKYNSFILEKEFEHWEFLYNSSNENFNTLTDKIDNFLSKEYEVDVDKFKDKVVNLFNRFKNKIGILSIITSLLLSTYMGLSDFKELLDKVKIEASQKQEVLKIAEDKVKTKSNKRKNDISKFLKALAKRESSSNPKIINNLGYIGKYQFGEMALKDVGLEDKINTDKFRKNPSIWPERDQDRAMIKLLKKNKSYLGEYLSEFEGKIINGVKITKSGLLAGSHLVGAGAVKQFLDSNGQFVPKDGNGVPVTDYIKKFGGYHLTF